MLNSMLIVIILFCFCSEYYGHVTSVEDNTDVLIGTPRRTHVFKESNTLLSLRRDITKQDRAQHDHHHEVIFVIQQRNMKELTSILHDISDPYSSNYGQHWSREDVVDFTSNPEGRDAVVTYLNSNGASIVSETLAGEYVTALAPVKVWEKIFKTEFYSYIVTHYDESVHTVIRAEDYWIPRELDKHVASVLNTIQLLTPIPISASRVPIASNIGKFASTGAPQGYMTPHTLRDYYNMSKAMGSVNSTQMIYASSNQYYSPKNLADFQRELGFPVQPAVLEHGGHSNDEICATNNWLCAEGNLDMQYIATMSPLSPTMFWYSDGSFTEFLIDISNIVNPPKVISISYGTIESDMTASEYRAFDDIAIKLSIMGTTIVAASGDDGANPFYVGSDISKCAYFVSFPAASQYVLAVGGTTVSQVLYFYRDCYIFIYIPPRNKCISLMK